MRAAAAAFALLAMAPAPAAAEMRAVELARSLCVANEARPTRVEETLAFQGWRRLSEEDASQAPLMELVRGFSMHWDGAHVWSLGPAGPLLALGAGRIGYNTMDFCVVAEARSFSRQVRDVRSWLGFDRFETYGPGGDLFVYLRDETGRLRNGVEANEAEAAAAVALGRTGYVVVIGDAHASVVNFGAVRPTPLPSQGSSTLPQSPAGFAR